MGFLKRLNKQVLVCIALLSVIISFQNCSQVEMASASDESFQSKGNGDVYSGKTFTYHLPIGICPDGTKDASQLTIDESGFELVRDNCVDLDPGIPVPKGQVQIVDEKLLIFDNREYLLEEEAASQPSVQPPTDIPFAPNFSVLCRGNSAGETIEVGIKGSMAADGSTANLIGAVSVTTSGKLLQIPAQTVRPLYTQSAMTTLVTGDYESSSASGWKAAIDLQSTKSRGYIMLNRATQAQVVEFQLDCEGVRY